jgi:inosine/xanthosine triphosphate pyrophosphatase family protein
MKKIEEIVIGSRNQAKVEYYQSILSEIAARILGLTDLGVEGKPLETGETAEENAEIKARFYAQKTGKPVFCEDEALYADFLPPDKQPGTKVRRINGVDEVDDDKLLSHWEKILSEVPEERRTGYWHIAYCLAFPDGRAKTVSLDHHIRFYYPVSKIRIPGWPMSSLEGDARLGKPNSERTQEEIKLAKEETSKAIVKKFQEILLEI